MKLFLPFCFIHVCLCLLLYHPLQAIDPTDTRLISQPAISQTHIAFIYAEDLWVANKDGSHPRRLTVDEGVESRPIFSPDGSLIAFNASYDGNIDVYTVPVEGGIPRRLTWHPYPDLVRDFTPDGNEVLFASQRNTFTNRHLQLFKIGVDEEKVVPLDIPQAYWASYHPDGNHLAYTPLADRFDQWKNYRGGTTSRIWVYNAENHQVSEIPKTEGGSNDTQPLWIGEKIYFLSDRDGEFNLFSYETSNEELLQLTDFQDFPVLNFAGNKEEIIFEQAGYLHSYNLSDGSHSKLTIGIATDLLEHRPRFVSGGEYIRSAAISPSGARIVVDFRGEIISLPASKGDPINLSNTPGVHERQPSWSPDGNSIAYFSDASGEYALHIKDQKGEAEVKTFPLDGAGFYNHIHWSPDSEKICFVDNSRSLYLLDIDQKTPVKIASDEVYTPGVYRDLFGSWSADGAWISYTIITETNFERAFLYEVEQNKSHPVTDGLSNVSDPVFDPSGKYLYLLASTDAGPVVNWFDQSNQDMQMSHSIYLITLEKSIPSPFSKENDMEKPKEDTTEKAEEEVEVPQVKVDWDGIENRIVNVPLDAGWFANLQVNKEGELFYLVYTPADNTSILHKYELKERKGEALMPADDFEIAANGEKTLYLDKGKWGIAETGKKPESEGLIDVDKVKLKIDPLAEWPNIFEEAWRVNRDYFYDPNMHGADWEAIKAKYSVFLEDLASKSDLYRVMQWMFSELAVGHHRFGSTGDSRVESKNIQGGLLGADYELANNRYRIKKIYGGLNWSPELRSPLTEPGVNINEGDYILEVNGEAVTGDDNFFRFFENTAEKITHLTISPTTDIEDARKVSVTPLASESALRNRDWVEGNLKKVDEASNGQVAYVYVPNTTSLGHEYFKRYFFPQANKKAIIIDERFNGGGQLADYYVDILNKPLQSYWNYRYGKDQKAPNASIQGPKVMLIDETAGSGGDYLPYLFRKYGLGTIIGKRTWGGLVGVLGFPEFIDGGSVTAPNLAFYDEDGFGIENEGVSPDIEVEQWPDAVIRGEDPQLDKAIEVIMEQLKAKPPVKMETPSYPVRVK